MVKAGIFSVLFLITSGVCSGQGSSFHAPNILQLKPVRPNLQVPPRGVRPLVFIPVCSAEKLPLFCRLEHYQSTSRGGIPVKFRLGSVEYVDWLEGKPWDPTKL